MSPVADLQSCLAAEHAAVYAYGVVGGVLAVAGPGSQDQAYAAASYDVHKARRDSLTELIDSLHATPVAAEPVYTMPFAVSDVTTCRRLARLVEHRSAAVYATAVASTVHRTRAMAARALTDCALREVRWGAAPQAFPGIAGR